MNNKIEKIINNLREKEMTISTMESCTGGGIANQITNVKGASAVLHFSAVTYSNEYKVKLGVSSKTIEKYSVYSMQTAREMAKSISDFSKSNLGIGVTGKLGVPDYNNNEGKDNEVFICIYDRDLDKYNDISLFVNSEDRKDDKLEIIEVLVDFLYKYV